MNMFRMLALGLIVAAASAGCDAPNSRSSIDRQDTPTGYRVDEAENQERNLDAEFAAGEDSKAAARGDLSTASKGAGQHNATDTMQGAEYGRARSKCDELSSGDVKDACIERAQADFARE